MGQSVYRAARWRKVESDMPHSLAAAEPDKAPPFQRRQTPGKFSGRGKDGRPKRTPRAPAAAAPRPAKGEALYSAR